MNQAQAEERFRNLKIAFDKFVASEEKRRGGKILFNPARIETEADKFRNKIEENLSCAS